MAKLLSLNMSAAIAVLPLKASTVVVLIGRGTPRCCRILSLSAARSELHTLMELVMTQLHLNVQSCFSDITQSLSDGRGSRRRLNTHGRLSAVQCRERKDLIWAS